MSPVLRTLNRPIAVEAYPNAVVLSPIAVEKLPLAVVPIPIDVERSPLAVVKNPIAVEASPLAVVLFPIAIDSSPLAVLPADCIPVNDDELNTKGFATPGILPPNTLTTLPVASVPNKYVGVPVLFAAL